MLLGDNVLKCDYSFMFPAHVAKMEKTSVFTALYTINIEYEEIIHQDLVLSNSFQKMQKAYVLYDHEMPIAFSQIIPK